MTNLLLESKRLRFRRFTGSDFENLRSLDSDPSVVRFLGNGKVRNEDESQKYLDKILRDYDEHGHGLYVTERKETGAFVGRTGLIPWSLDGELVWEVGYTLGKDYWGAGLANEAAQFWLHWGFANLPVSFLVSLIHPDNAASKRVAQKIGMQFWMQKKLNGFLLDAFRIKGPGKAPRPY